MSEGWWFVGISTRVPTPQPQLLAQSATTATITNPSTAHTNTGTDIDAVDAGDDYEGYSPPAPCDLAELCVGDLIEIDEGSGVWVVVDEPPEDDLLAPGMVAISWRGDGDESGSISVTDDTQIPVRRPQELIG